MAALLEMAGLSVRLGGQPVLAEVSLAVASGEGLALVGASGSGKTTLLRACLGLLPPTAHCSGRLQWTPPAGASLDLRQATARRWRELRRREVAWIPQEPAAALDPRRTAAAHLAECLAPEMGGRAHQRGRVADALQAVGLAAARGGDYPHQWSGGMQQRLLVAMALARRPQLLLADEPTSALDGPQQRQLLDLLVRLRAEGGFAVLWVSHDLALAAVMAERVAVLAQGRIVEEGAAGRVLRRPQHPASAALAAAQPAWPPAAEEPA